MRTGGRPTLSPRAHELSVQPFSVEIPGRRQAARVEALSAFGAPAALETVGRVVREHLRRRLAHRLLGRATTPSEATVEALQLNREGLVNLRRVLYLMGEHPPQTTPEYNG